MTGEELRKRREALHLSQAGLAAKIGVSANTVARWERGERKMTNPKMLDIVLRQLEGDMNKNYLLTIETWPIGLGAPVQSRESYHDTTQEAIAHLDAQTEPYAYAYLQQRVPGVGYYPCDWQGNSIGPGRKWPDRKGTNGQHPALIAYLKDEDRLVAEVLRRWLAQPQREILAGYGTTMIRPVGLVSFAVDVLREFHPEITRAESLAKKAWELYQKQEAEKKSREQTTEIEEEYPL